MPSGRDMLMRVWDLSPGHLNDRSLLGEHRELHGIVSILANHHLVAAPWLFYNGSYPPNRRARCLLKNAW